MSSFKSYKSYKGKYNLVNPDKYIGKNFPYYKSNLEHHFMKFCDLSDSVKLWQYEGFGIPYINPTKPNDKKNPNANYYPDFYIEYVDKNGKYHKAVIEVKSKNETMSPPPQQRKTKKWLKEFFTYAVNESKWKQAKLFCESVGLEFMIVTEDFIRNHLV